MVDYNDLLDFIEESGLTERQQISTLLDMVQSSEEEESDSGNSEEDE